MHFVGVPVRSIVFALTWILFLSFAGSSSYIFIFFVLAFWQIILIDFDQKQQKEYLQLAESYFLQLYQINYNKTHMKIASPFVQFIPDCKRNMRRLRKKIYKFMTSRNYTKRNENKESLILILKNRNIPTFLLETLAKKKYIDLNAIRNIHLNVKLPIEDITQLTAKQENSVSLSYELWEEENHKKHKTRGSHSLEDKERELLSRNTISSTQFQCDESVNPDSSFRNIANPESYCQSLQSSLHDNLNFDHFDMGSGFMQLQSILSEQNIFKFQQ